MNYGIIIQTNDYLSEVLNIKLYDFNKKILFQLTHSHEFYPSKMDGKEIFCTHISEKQFYDILNNLKLDKKFLKIKDFCLRYQLEELII